MARNIVPQEVGEHGPVFPECFIQGADGRYEPDPATAVRQYGWHGDPWRTRATMVKIRLNQDAIADCPAFLLSLAENGDVYLTQATECAVLPAGAKLVTAVNEHCSIDRVVLRLQETASQAV